MTTPINPSNFSGEFDQLEEEILRDLYNGSSVEELAEDYKGQPNMTDQELRNFINTILEENQEAIEDALIEEGELTDN